MSYEGAPEDVIRKRILEEEDRLAVERGEELSKIRVDPDAGVDVQTYRTEKLDSIGEMIPEVLSRIAAHNYPDGELMQVEDARGKLSEKAVWQIGYSFTHSSYLISTSKEPDGNDCYGGFETEHAAYLGSDGRVYYVKSKNINNKKVEYIVSGVNIPVDSVDAYNIWADAQKAGPTRGHLSKFILKKLRRSDNDFEPDPKDESIFVSPDDFLNVMENGLKRMKRKYAVIEKKNH